MPNKTTVHADTLLIVEDDPALNLRLAQAMADRGYEVISATSISEATARLDETIPSFAIVDMRLGDGNGLEFMAALKEKAPDCRAIILSGYGSIPAAVSAINAGAFDFLAKPADADEIHNALRATRHDELLIPFAAPSSDRIRREHIVTVYEQYGCNVSETARRLGMHRRTLQRILSKDAPRA